MKAAYYIAEALILLQLAISDVIPELRPRRECIGITCIRQEFHLKISQKTNQVDETKEAKKFNRVLSFSVDEIRNLALLCTEKVTNLTKVCVDSIKQFEEKFTGRIHRLVSDYAKNVTELSTTNLDSARILAITAAERLKNISKSASKKLKRVAKLAEKINEISSTTRQVFTNFVQTTNEKLLNFTSFGLQNEKRIKEAVLTFEDLKNFVSKQAKIFTFTNFNKVRFFTKYSCDKIVQFIDIGSEVFTEIATSKEKDYCCRDLERKLKENLGNKFVDLVTFININVADITKINDEVVRDLGEYLDMKMEFIDPGESPHIVKEPEEEDVEAETFSNVVGDTFNEATNYLLLAYEKVKEFLGFEIEETENVLKSN